VDITASLFGVAFADSNDSQYERRSESTGIYEIDGPRRLVPNQGTSAITNSMATAIMFASEKVAV
jgi:hypothetical protein